MKKENFFLLMGLLCLSSCISNKKLVIASDKSVKKPHKAEYSKSMQRGKNACEIATGDYLALNIYYTELSGEQYLSENVINTEKAPLQVDDEGNIQVPAVGDIKVKGLTSIQAVALIQESVSKHFKDPIVHLRIINGNATLLGELERPGVVPIEKCGTSIFKALAMAGGTTQWANLESVKVIRETPDSAKIYFIDLTNDSLFSTGLHLIYPDDIIYIKPLARKHFSIRESQTFFRSFSLLVSVATLAIAIIRLQ
ncbi:MAG: polysaccharide biosynthesis/export family protein [Bacteroidetes bacterium]|nr:polysaccharide biosynthesis/export family protein [Bacteroidota bacterium]